MAELENNIVPQMNDLLYWNRYVDDTFAFVKPVTEYTIQELLNKYHPSIKFTYECEDSNKIPFLDVLITKEDDGTLQTSVFRKITNTEVYMNWHSYAPKAWKVATLRSLIKRAYRISSTESALSQELDHLKKAFVEINQYPKKLIEQTIASEKEYYGKNKDQKNNKENDDKDTITLNLPYAGENGENIIKKLKKDVTNALRKTDGIKTRVVYKAKKLSERFPIKDKTELKHLHNVVYHVKCPNEKCKSEYIGQTRCRVGKRATEHNKTDKNSHILKHSEKTKHRRAWLKDFKVRGQGYQSNFKRKISESLFVREIKPDLNVQKDAYKLSLFH